MYHFIILVLIPSVSLLFFLVKHNFFNIFRIYIRHKFWFYNFISDFCSYEFSCCLVAVFRATSFVFVAVSKKHFSYLLYFPCFLQMTHTHILWCIFLFLVLYNNVSFLFINKKCQINFVFYVTVISLNSVL